MVKNSNDLEKKFIENAFKNLDRKVVCPHENCQYIGTHFRCYDLSFEKCDIYIKFEQRKQLER